MTTSSLLDGLSDFCRSSATNVEVMDDSLRRAINIPTSLVSVVETAISRGQSVVLSGTAGSGKTHLLESVGQPSGYTVCRDLASDVNRWPSLLLGDRPCLVAGNEGALLKGARQGLTGFADAVDHLHRIQRGEEVSGGKLVVIDVAGFDPVGNHVIKDMLALPLLSDYIAAKGDDFRTDAWNCLNSVFVRERVASLLESTVSDADGFTFRRLWQFVGDLIDRGQGENGIWFYRLLNGESLVSERLRQYFDIADVALPHIGNRLWHGDAQGDLSRFVPEAHPILKRLTMTLPADEEARRRRFRLIRLLCYLAMPETTTVSGSEAVWSDVCGGRVESVLNLINQFMSYGLLPLGDDLYLWFEHSTERRDNKSDSMFAFGTAPANEFQIVRSRCVANSPTNSPFGGRRMLLHTPTGTMLQLSKELVDGVKQTRSHRTKDRDHVELDWRLGSFLSSVASASARVDRLTMARFNFESRSGLLSYWEMKPQFVRKVRG